MWGSDLRARERVGRWMATAGGAWRRQCVQAAESFRRAQQADRPAARHLPWPGLFADQFLSAGQAVRLRKHRPDSAARCPARRACASSCDGLPLNPELRAQSDVSYPNRYFAAMGMPPGRDPYLWTAEQSQPTVTPIARRLAYCRMHPRAEASLVSPGPLPDVTGPDRKASLALPGPRSGLTRL